MRNKISKRVKALEKQRAEYQAAVERQAFLGLALPMVLAHFLGGLKPKESLPWDGYARALRYRNHDAFLRDFVRVFKGEDASELQDRQHDAIRRLFAEFPFDRSSQAALEELIIKIAKLLPPQRLAWIDNLVAEVNYEEELRQKEQTEKIWSELEVMACRELRGRKKH